MSPIDLHLPRFPYGPRWFIDRVWGIERAFGRAKAEGRAEDDTRLRIFFVLALFATAFLALAAGAARSALFADNDRTGAEGAPPGARAELVDRNGQLLAADLPHFGLYYDPKENWNPDEVRRVLPTVVPELPLDRLDKALKADRRQYLIGGLTPQEKDKIDDLGLPGLSFEPEPKRAYLLGATAGQLIGFVDKGGVGLYGVELGMDKTIRDNAGKGPIALSIDLRVQAALQDEVNKAAKDFNAEGASGIVVDVRTGEILGLMSYPAFDPNLGPDQPGRIDHTTDSDYEPGSVFKVFTLAMGIDSGLVTMNSILDTTTPLIIGGKPIHDDEKAPKNYALWEVFTHSSNIGAARLGLMAGPDRLERYFRSFGLFAAAPSELRESARPIVPQRMSDTTLAHVSFGQAISVTPLMLATGMTAVLNGGEYIPLTLRKLGPGDRPQGRRVISEATSRTMLDLMRLNATLGTGKGANDAAPGYRVGGKTGTAQKAVNGHYIAGERVSSFAAVFPTDGPIDAQRYLVFILLDNPKPTKDSGGFAMGAQTAAPTAGRVIERIAPILGVKRAPVVPVTTAANTSSGR